MGVFVVVRLGLDSDSGGLEDRRRDEDVWNSRRRDSVDAAPA